MAAGEISLESFTGGVPTPAPESSEPKAPPAGELSLEQFSGVKATPTTSFGYVLKSNVSTLAAVGDFVWGFFPLAEGVGRDIGARAAAAGSGESRRIGAQAGQIASQDTILPQNPLQRLMKAAGYGEDYDKSDVTKGLTWLSEHLDKGGEWIEKNTNGVLLKEDVSSLTNVLMLGLLNLRKGGLVKPEPKSVEMAGKGPAESTSGARESYYTPDPEVAAAEASIVKPRIKLKSSPSQVREISPEAFQIGTVEGAKSSELPPGVRRGDRGPTPYDDLPGGTDPVVGQWEGPGGEFEETTAKPGLVERGKALLRDDRRWSPRDEKDQIGKADPELLAWIAAGGTTAAFIAANPDKAKEIGLGAVAVAGAVKGKGGMWHPEAVKRLSNPIFESISRVADTPKDLESARTLTDRMVKNYLNKHAGTESDPLSKVEIPIGNTTIEWGEAWDLGVNPRKFEGAGKVGDLDVRPGETVFDLHRAEGGVHQPTRVRTDVVSAIGGYLSHVGDYLRQKVAPEKLQQYDLVRAVKETAKWDEELARQMNKEQADITKQVPIYKEYPDGFKWVELKAKPGARVPEGITLGKVAHEKGRVGYQWEDSKGEPVESVGGGGASGYGPVIYQTQAEAHAAVPKMLTARMLKAEGDMMGHCVGGYCDYVESGETKIYSLRDSKGGSHVTIEVVPKGVRNENLGPEGGDPNFGEPRIAESDSIAQIKGKQNRAPAPEYLPYVQDFVKSGKWGAVGDAYNAGLFDLGANAREADYPVEAMRKAFPGQSWITLEEGKRFLDQYNKTGLDAPDIHGDFPGERGSVDPKLLGRMALLGSGAALGAYLDQDAPVTGAIVGTAVAALAPRALKATGAAAGQLAKGHLSEAAKELIPGPISQTFATDKARVKIEKEMNAAELFSRRAELARNRLINSVIELVPESKGRERVAHFLEGNTGLALTAKEMAAASSMKKFFGEQATAGLDAGVLKDTIENYVTHIFGKGNLPLVDALMQAKASGSATTPFAKARTGPPTIAEINAWMAQNGKNPITADIAKIAEVYGRSLTRAIANKSVLDVLKLRTTNIISGGKDVERPLLMRPGKAPGTYEPVGRTGWMAHPDIVPALKFIFSVDDSSSFVRGVEALNTAAKRSAVMLSLFHAKNLVDAFAGASKLQPGKIAAGAALGAAVGLTQDDPVTYAMIGAGLGMALPGAKVAAQAAIPKVFGENTYVKALRKNDPQLAKLIDLSFQGGLEYSLKGGGLAVEDIGGAFYQGLQAAQATLDSYLPPASAALKGVEKLNHAMDGFLWERLHTGMKLSIFAEKYETLLQNNAKAHASNPRVPLMAEEKLAQIAASFTNDIFGGLNWRRVADEAKTKWGAALAQGTYSPTGRRVLQLLMFAPDWTIATTRSAMKAFGSVVGQESGTGLKGIMNPTQVADLHRQYMLRSALYYVLVGDGLNVALSGHHLWENKDPTYIEMKDGRKIQYSKHTMEPYHWLLNPIQQGMNKLGQVPKEVLNQAFGTEYLAPRIDRGGSVVAGPKMEGSRLGHVGRTINPIGAKQFVEGGVTGGAMGSFGMPIYGKTKEERERLRQKRQLDKLLRGGVSGTRG